jgi:hypothetical protein
MQNEIALPISSATRDSLSALFYARTLPLVPGYAADIPVNESGRNVAVHLMVVGEEMVTVGGRSTSALRIQPTLRYAVETRRPIQITLWLSHDARHLPLIMAFDTDFGAFRAELQSYRSN